MSRFKSREEEMLKSVRYRDRIITFLALALAISITGLVRAPHVIDVYQAPDPRFGNLNQPGAVPPTAVYTFASHIFTLLNTWPNDGAQDYKANGSRLSAYLTPNYFKEVWDDADSRLAANELKGRTRTVSLADGAAYTDAAVKLTGDDAWVVFLDLHLEERVDNNVVKDVNVRYPLRIIKRRISRDKNPWQLAIDGFASTPVRLLVDSNPDVDTNS